AAFEVRVAVFDRCLELGPLLGIHSRARPTFEFTVWVPRSARAGSQSPSTVQVEVPFARLRRKVNRKGSRFLRSFDYVLSCSISGGRTQFSGHAASSHGLDQWKNFRR